MTITTELMRTTPFAGDGTTRVLTVPFRFLDEDDLKVIEIESGVETTLLKNTHYTTTGEGNQNGGTVVLTYNSIVGRTYVIEQDPPLTQTNDLANNTAEGYLDQLTIRIQKAFNQGYRALGQNVSDTAYDANSKKITNLADGTFDGDAVNYSQLTSVLNASLTSSTFRGPWIIDTAYTVGDFVRENNSTYFCYAAHTSDASNRPEIGASYKDLWVLIAKGFTSNAVEAANPLSVNTLVVGDGQYGLSNLSSSEIEDLETLAGGGPMEFHWRRAYTDTINAPTGAVTQGSHVLNFTWNAASSMQLFLEHYNAQIYCRSKHPAGWSEWNKALVESDLDKTIKTDVSDHLTVGYTADVFDAGTYTNGVFAVDPTNGNFQKITNGGAHTITPDYDHPAYSVIVSVLNNENAGTITLSGFDKQTGDSLNSNNGHKFVLYITRVGILDLIHVVAMQ